MAINRGQLNAINGIAREISPSVTVLTGLYYLRARIKTKK